MSRRRAIPPDPRVVGGTYYCGYWRVQYTVLTIEPAHCLSSTCWTVRWADDGRITHHGTAWDGRRDRIVEVSA